MLFDKYYFVHHLRAGRSTVHLVAEYMHKMALCGRKREPIWELNYEVIDPRDIIMPKGNRRHACLSCRQQWSRHLERQTRIAAKNQQIARRHLGYTP